MKQRFEHQNIYQVLHIGFGSIKRTLLMQKKLNRIWRRSFIDQYKYWKFDEIANSKRNSEIPKCVWQNYHYHIHRRAITL